ncbi:putative periplasmic serine endoprotease DegP-like precursor [compost metagenome]
MITSVKPGSPAAEKGLEPGQVIVEVAQEFVETPDDVGQTLSALKNEGRRSAYVMIADTEGNLRHVAIPLE